MQKINQLLVNKLIELGLTLSTCESMTGGLLGNNFVCIENASKVFYGGVVAYNISAKKNVLKIDSDLLNQYGTVSEQCAHCMAEKVQRIFNTDLAISVTGNASLTNPCENKSSGMAYITIILFDKKYDYQFVAKFAKNRCEIITECVIFIMNKLYELISTIK